MPNVATSFANGVFVDTGQPWPDDAGIAPAIDALLDARSADLARKKLQHTGQPRWGAVADVDPNDLGQAGWGVVFAANAEPELKDALRPMLDRRRGQTGPLYREFCGADGYRPGESAAAWLSRHRVAMMPVEPLHGVPYYLLLAGSPADIPFEFQYDLDVFWGVGRLSFEAPAGYRAYAESVCAYEDTRSPLARREIEIFATRHDFDPATELFATHVAEALSSDGALRGALGLRQGFTLIPTIGDGATRDALREIFRPHGGLPPALLFSGTHGAVFKPDDRRLRAGQGAIVCQDFPGWGRLAREHWFEGADLPDDARVHGLIHVLFACYGGGFSEYDDFADKEQTRPQQSPAPEPFVAHLPQALLGHRDGGALAVLAHVGRAWSHSFSTPGGAPQVQALRDVMTRVLQGDRLGMATDQFDVRRAALASQLQAVERSRGFGLRVEASALAAMRTAYFDARNYIVIGDPAVRLSPAALVERAGAPRSTD